MRESDAPSLLLTDTKHEYLRDTEEFAVLPLSFVSEPFAPSIDVEVKDEVFQSDISQDRSQDTFESQDPLNDTAQTIETTEMTSETLLKQTVTVTKRRKNSSKM